MVNPIASLAAPSLVDWPRDEAAHDGLPWEIWWITATLTAAERRLAVQVILIHLDGGSVTASASVTDLGTEAELNRTLVCAPGQAGLDVTRLGVTTDAVTFEGSFEDGYHLRADLDDRTSFALTLVPTAPILHSCGGGEFRLGASRTTQYSIGALAATGSVTTEGHELVVEGNAWYDRQWAHAGSLADGFATFTWFGICLQSGEVISFWDTSMRSAGGATWVTVVRPDGTHLVASAEPAADGAGESFEAAYGRCVPRTWRLSVLALGCELDVTQRAVHGMAGIFFHTGALEVNGTFEGAGVTGYGYCDLVGWPEASER